MSKVVSMVMAVVVSILLICTIVVPTIQGGHDLFHTEVEVKYTNTGDEIALGSQDEEYTVDWDSALPGTIKVNGNTPTVYFVAGEGASVSPTQKDVVEGLTYGELPLPTRTGYTFDGWYDSTEYTTEITDTTVVVGTEDKILYAKWVGNQYTVTFDADGGTVSPATKTVTFGQDYGELPVPTYTGHIFGGWFDENDNPIVAQSEVSIADDHTLTAVWTLEQYLVSFTTDGNGTVDVAEVLVDYGTSYTISNNTITIDGTTVTATPSLGYVWDYWEPSTAGTVTSAMTFIAHFNNPPVTLSFTTDGTTGATVSQASIADVPRGSTYVVADNTVTVTHGSTTLGTVTASLVNGYYFVGWSEAQGVGTVSDAMTFEAQYDLIEIIQVSASELTTWILDSNGHVWGTGSNGSGQQGSGDTTNVLTFTDRTPSGVTVEQVFATYNATWILDSNGHVWGCGRGYNNVFTDYTPSGITVEQISAGNGTENNQGTAWILDSNGDVWGIGYGQNGQQGSGTTQTAYSFTKRTPSGVTVEQVIATDFSTWILDSNGHVWGTGSNSSGQQGSGDTTNVLTFTDRTPSGVTVEQISVSNYTSWILDSTGHVWGTGNNSKGQQGSGDTTNVLTFTDRTPSGVTVEQISVSNYTSWILDSTGHVWGVGDNVQGQQGSGNTTKVLTFTDRTPSGVTVEQISVAVCDNEYHETTWILDSTGQIWGTGSNYSGKLSTNQIGYVVSFSKRLEGTPIEQIITTDKTSWALDSAGHVWGCGGNGDGQQGSGDSGDTTNVGVFTQRGPPGSINIQPVLSPQINPLSPINLNPLHPFTPIPIQPLSIDYTAITGFSTWQLGGEDWMLATVTTGVDEYALALYYAGLTEPLVWDEDVHMVFDNGTLTVENGGQTYTMTYSSIYYRSSSGNYRLLNTSATVLDDTPILAYGVPTDDSGALAKGTVGNLTAVSIADGQITLDGATASAQDTDRPNVHTLSSVSFTYDTDQTSTAIAVIVPSQVSFTEVIDDPTMVALLDAIPLLMIFATLVVIAGAMFTRR